MDVEQKAIDDIRMTVDTMQHDKEMLHVACDEIIEAFLRNVGHEKLADAYKEASEFFWYA